MALSNAEKQKRYRERKAARAGAQAEPAPVPVKRSFAEFIQSSEDRMEAMDVSAFNLNELPYYEWQDRIAKEDAIDFLTRFVGDDSSGAIMGLWTIAALVNDYRLEQIDVQLIELQSAQHDNDTVRQASELFAERLRNTRKELQRADRYSFRPMSVASDWPRSD